MVDRRVQATAGAAVARARAEGVIRVSPDQVSAARALITARGVDNVNGLIRRIANAEVPALKP